MLLNDRPIAIGFSVLGFFGIAIVGWFSGLSQLTCCKRAIVAAFFVYVAVSIAMKVVNIILTEALIDSQMKQQPKEQVK
ncbi:MAG: hypothetical protein LLF92_07285 [Planctomycetaceae bacterium]|nr:hypothetical protein [Planctomycetaceae bacterium]